MDVLNGTPALFLILLLYNSSMLAAYIEDERFFQCLQTLVGCGLSGPTSPLAFGEAVLGAIGRSAGSVQNKEQLWRMWSAMVSPLTDTITQSNEVNQGDALEHNFSAVHSALLFPITHLLRGAPLQQAAQKSMLSSWSKLYKVFARCSALVVTAEENICCEELCAKMTAAMDRDALTVPSTLNAVASILQVMVECVDFSPYTPQFQQKLKSPHTPVNWMRKRNKVLGNLSTFQSLLVQCLDVYLEDPEASSEATGLALVSILSALFTNFALANTILEALTSLIQPLTLFYKQAASEPPKFSSLLLGKSEKLLSDVLGCLQTRSTLPYDDELLALLSPLLCVAFTHKNKQLRSSVTQFWNATFANSVSLTYPDEIRPILSQVKQKTPLILPGFEVVSVPDELSGQYSSENSQLETKLSGMPVSSAGKRDSLLGKTAELKDRNSMKTSKAVSTKLDFGSPKPPSRGVLEEEASIDFVFIPPETKERVLTEHQKEVKRTKRVDIPAMYNNLDASLDTTVFTQYTQSQEDSLDKLATEQADKVTKEAHGKVPQEDVEKEERAEETKETQDYASPKMAENITPENREQEENVLESTDVSMEDVAKSADVAEDLEMASKEGTSPNISGSLDLVSGTPQKPNSRRQTFITLEKYAEGKPASPSSASTFTGPLIKTSNSQEYADTSRKSSSQASQTSTGPDSQDSQSSQTAKTNSQHPVNDALDSPVRPGTKSEPVRLTERLPSDPTEDEDVIPDTQTEVGGKESTKMASSEKMKPSSQEEESEPTLDDSQSSVTQISPGEPRRSGRCRVRPLLPGEDSREWEDKYFKRRRSEEEPKSDSQKLVQSRPNTRSKQAAEEERGRDGLRTRSQRDKSSSSQTNSQGRAHKKIRLYSNSDDFLDKPSAKRRSTREHESSQTDLQSDNESQSQGRQRRRSSASLETKEEGGMKKKVLSEKEESSQTIKCELVEKTQKGEKPEKDSQMITHSLQTVSKSEEFKIAKQTEKDVEKHKDSQIVTVSPQTGDQSQESELREKTEKEDSQIVVSSPTNDADRPSTSTKSVNESEVKDKLKTSEDTDDNLSQDNSQVITTSSSDSQSLRRSRRSKASSEAAESGDESENKDSVGRQSRSNSQSAVGQPGGRTGGRTRRSKVQEEQSKSSPPSTPGSSQSLDTAVSTEFSQGRGRHSRRISSSALPASSLESSESESQDVNSQMPIKRGRKPRASPPSPLTIESKEGKINNDIVKNGSDTSQKVLPVASMHSESSEAKENSQIPQKRGRKPRASLPSPLAIESKECKINNDMVIDDSDTSQRADSQSIESKTTTVFEDSQISQDLQGSESLQVTRRRSSQALPVASLESSESESSEAKENPPVPKKRGRKPQASFQSPLTIDSDAGKMNNDMVKGDSQSMEVKTTTDLEDSQKSQELQDSESLQVTRNTEEQSNKESSMEVEVNVVVEQTETDNAKNSDSLSVSARKEEEPQTNTDNTSIPESDSGDLPSAEMLESVEVSTEQIQEELPCDQSSSAEDTLASPDETTGNLQVSGSTEEKAEGVSESGDSIAENQQDDSHSSHQEHPVVPLEDTAEDSHSTPSGQNHMECPTVIDDISKEEEQSASNNEDESANLDIAPLQENDGDDQTQTVECQDEEQTETADAWNDVVAHLDAALADVCSASVLSQSTSKDISPDSPAKQKDLEALMGADVGQSPNSSRTRGTWSPSASPSTSILKKGLKRPLEEEATSPLVKSRRVSFANPIQHQEMADDIDRRSPAIRTSSPRRSKGSSIPQPKYVTTPTKGLLILSPRNLHSPTYKSSKKCLISEMSQEPRPVPRDCIYPALVGCSTPVEAVLPQISSNMWSRGFGQLVRARNIKTVGDLSALTPSEIKTLPIRSPKISNVKKALKVYEQQRKGRGGDELKSFDEMEMMTSELEDTSAPQNQDEEDKTAGETLATELVDEPVPSDGRPEQDGPENQTPTGDRLHPEGLQSEVEALTCRMTPLELSYCSPQQLVQMHDQLGGMMSRVVVELQTRLCQTDGKP